MGSKIKNAHYQRHLFAAIFYRCVQLIVDCPLPGTEFSRTETRPRAVWMLSKQLYIRTKPELAKAQVECDSKSHKKAQDLQIRKTIRKPCAIQSKGTINIDCAPRRFILIGSQSLFEKFKCAFAIEYMFALEDFLSKHLRNLERRINSFSLFVGFTTAGNRKNRIAGS